MRENTCFQKIKDDRSSVFTDKKNQKNGHNQDEKLPFSLKVGNSWRLVKSFMKVYVLHCRFSGWWTKTKAFPSTD